MSNSTKRKLNFKNATGNNMTNDQMYAKIKNKISGLEKKRQIGIEKRKKYKFILNNINTRIEELDTEIQDGKIALKGLNNIKK
jgi:hypothetical protein|tara:strand:- start:778 stop:1026 length:249 start_codon:yes stop_codon:yes gene_type:complete